MYVSTSCSSLARFSCEGHATLLQPPQCVNAAVPRSIVSAGCRKLTGLLRVQPLKLERRATLGSANENFSRKR
jgi:hypothetical protein